MSAALVLVTRPLPEADETAVRIRALGYRCMIEPMLEIAPLVGAPLCLQGIQVLLVTSRNGARALAGRSADRTMRVFAVGEATANQLRDLGFTNVESAAGSGRELVERVRQSCDPAGGALLHVRGDRVAVDPVPMLQAAGFEARSVILYEARTPSAFTENLERTMRQRALRYALFFSPRTARTFVTLAHGASLDACCSAIEACCLSAAVAAGLEKVRWRRVRVSVRPEQEALLDMLPPLPTIDG
ncbi:MAG TPA: uroporphyrinogen-III synthase [Alphaproteobacteria bacterium]|nr:uroporphyrinogen-III synthase [Alphaproteobacteria bacterium]